VKTVCVGAVQRPSAVAELVRICAGDTTFLDLWHRPLWRRRCGKRIVLRKTGLQDGGVEDHGPIGSRELTETGTYMSSTNTLPSIALVHGDCRWLRMEDVYRSQERRLSGQRVQNPTTSLEADVAATKLVLARWLACLPGRPLVRGVVITESATIPKWRAWSISWHSRPIKGESVPRDQGSTAGGSGAAHPSAAERCSLLDQGPLCGELCRDVDPDKAAFMSSSQFPGLDALNGR